MSLKKSIETAFAGVPKPAADNITHCPYNCSECRRIAIYFRDQDATGRTLAELLPYHSALSLFTPEAIHYFLPAFMVVSLDSYTKGDPIPDAIRFHFEYSHEARSHYAVRMSKFTQEQRDVIIDYLALMEEKGAGSADLAIEFLSDEEAFV